MANPLPFASTSNDTVDWVKAVTPVTVSGGGTVTPSGTIITTIGATISTTLSSAGTHFPIGINDGLQHYLTAAQLTVIVTAFSGTPPWTGRLLLASSSPQIDMAQCVVGIESFPAAGGLVQNTTTITYPNGFQIPIKSLGTGQLEYDFFVDVGSGTFSAFISIFYAYV